MAVSQSLKKNEIDFSKDACAIQWAVEGLSQQDILIDTSKSRIVAQTPWSLVVLLKSAHQNTYYLKIAAKGLGDEAKILKFLRTQYSQNVPVVVLENEETGAFVTQELGINLRSVLKTGTGHHFLEKAVLDFADLQKETAVDILALHQIGLPDWSLDRIPQLCARLFEDKQLLLSDGLTQGEYKKLTKVQKQIEQACKNLLTDNVPLALVQCDFHDNNIVVDTKSNTVGFIDLGEVVISHPFYSILTFMKQMRKHHADLLSENQLDGLYKKYEACWGIKTSESFQQSIGLTWLIFEALGQYRLFQSCCVEELRARQKGKLAASLRELINK